MDNLEQRLRDDAAEIRVDVPPHVSARLQASLRAARTAAPARRQFSFPLWLAASLTGVAASAVAIVAVNWGGLAGRGPEPAEAVAYSVPEYVSELERQIPLRAKTADLTGPLEEELENLRSDFERAKKNVEQDLDFTF